MRIHRTIQVTHEDSLVFLVAFSLIACVLWSCTSQQADNTSQSTNKTPDAQTAPQTMSGETPVTQETAPNSETPVTQEAAPNNEEIPHPTPEATTKPDYLKEDISGTAWVPTPEQLEAIHKEYPKDYHVDGITCKEASGCDDDDMCDEYSGDDCSSIDSESPKTEAEIQKEKAEHQRELAEQREHEAWEKAKAEADAAFCEKLGLSKNISCEFYSGHDELGFEYVKLSLQCGSWNNRFVFPLKILRDTKQYKITYDWLNFGSFEYKISQYECAQTGDTSNWRCINPEGCGEHHYSEHRCREYALYSDDICYCDGDADTKGDESLSESFICDYSSNDKRLHWTCNSESGCNYHDELIPYKKGLVCNFTGSEIAYGNCYCNGIKRSFADESKCNPPSNSEGEYLRPGYPILPFGNKPSRLLSVSEVPFIHPIEPGQMCTRSNGCMCEGEPCPQSGVCTVKGCIDIMTGAEYVKDAGYRISGLYKQCVDPEGCPCGESTCIIGEACVNNWYCSDEIQTEISGRKRYVYDGGKRYKEDIVSWINEYEYLPCKPENLNGMDPGQYMCMYSFYVSFCAGGCFTSLDEVDHIGLPVERCALSEGCTCGDGVCPEYSRCIAGRCYYDQMYEMAMCGRYSDSSAHRIFDVANIEQNSALEPSENIDVSGNCLINGFIRPAKYKDFIDHDPDRRSEFIIKAAKALLNADK